eukprot:TRINITY_DN67818_c0_g1_i1.p1 TRINITY_DN67818_c0_g1~~TRINITY_DN67818_c0_g1_i1.p1  ORF type:complete len:1011 (+),score=167.98 TRINITY_DN67818_c0_g1_i1:132-3035(+)
MVTLHDVLQSLQKWSLDGPPPKLQAAAGELATRLSAAIDIGNSSAVEVAKEQKRSEVGEAHTAEQRVTRLLADERILRRRVDALSHEVAHLRQREASLAAQVASVLSPVSVVCRVRPMESYGVAEQSPRNAITTSDGGEITVEDANGRARRFRVDRFLDGSSNQEDVFRAASPWIESVLLGGSVCFLAYGATGSGKTYTVNGNGHGSICEGCCPGISHHAMKQMFNHSNTDTQAGGFDFSRAREGGLHLSMLEVYCDQIRDLLAEATDGGDPPVLQCSRRDAQGRIFLDSVELYVQSFEAAQDVLRRGYRNAANQATLCNDRSSRSHVVLMIRAESQTAGNTPGKESASGGRLVLVDLAGSENVQRSGADECGKLLAEAKAINRSLSALADVVEASAKRQAFVPFRNSRLTMLLEETLSSSKVLLFVHVSPQLRDATDTGHSLTFASRIRSIDFGAQQLRRDQEERLRAAHQRDQQENRALQGQIDQLRKEMSASQAANQDLKQQTAHLSEQLREKQRELVRERELRSRFEESAREQKYGCGSSSLRGGSACSSFSSGVLGSSSSVGSLASAEESMISHADGAVGIASGEGDIVAVIPAGGSTAQPSRLRCPHASHASSSDQHFLGSNTPVVGATTARGVRSPCVLQQVLERRLRDGLPDVVRRAPSPSQKGFRRPPSPQQKKLQTSSREAAVSASSRSPLGELTICNSENCVGELGSTTEKGLISATTRSAHKTTTSTDSSANAVLSGGTGGSGESRAEDIGDDDVPQSSLREQTGSSPSGRQADEMMCSISWDGTKPAASPRLSPRSSSPPSSLQLLLDELHPPAEGHLLQDYAQQSRDVGVRSALRKKSTNFAARRLQRQLGVTAPSTRIRFSEETPVPQPAPPWYLELFAEDLIAAGEEPTRARSGRRLRSPETSTRNVLNAHNSSSSDIIGFVADVSAPTARREPAHAAVVGKETLELPRWR